VDREHYTEDLEQRGCSMSQAAGKWKNRTEPRGKYSSSPIVGPLEDGIHTNLYSTKNCENESEALQNVLRKLRKRKKEEEKTTRLYYRILTLQEKNKFNIEALTFMCTCLHWQNSSDLHVVKISPLNFQKL